MTDIPEGYAYVRDAAKTHNTSRSTIERKRDKARDEEADDETYAQFLLITKNGSRHESPTKQFIDELHAAGQLPVWLVKKSWLDKLYALRTPDDSKASTKAAGDSSSDDAADSDIRVAFNHYAQQLAKKDDQLERSDEQIKELQNQLKFQLVLNLGMQKRLGLASGDLSADDILNTNKTDDDDGSITVYPNSNPNDPPAPTDPQPGDSGSNEKPTKQQSSLRRLLKSLPKISIRK